MHQDAVDGLDAGEDSRSLRRCVDRGSSDLTSISSSVLTVSF